MRQRIQTCRRCLDTKTCTRRRSLSSGNASQGSILESKAFPAATLRPRTSWLKTLQLYRTSQTVEHDSAVGITALTVLLSLCVVDYFVGSRAIRGACSMDLFRPLRKETRQTSLHGMHLLRRNHGVGFNGGGAGGWAPHTSATSDKPHRGFHRIADSCSHMGRSSARNPAGYGRHRSLSHSVSDACHTWTT